MSDKVIVIAPSDGLKKNMQTACDKFEKMFGQKIDVIACDNSSQAMTHTQAREVGLIFTEHPMDTADANAFKAGYVKLKKKPSIITSAANYNHLLSHIKSTEMIKSGGGFTANYIFTCLRNLFTPAGNRLDIRYIKSILTSVIEVIESNTTIRLGAGAIVEEKEKELPLELAAVFGFSGDGFLGSLTITTSRSLIALLHHKMFGSDINAINDEDILDILAELTNQILGVVRNELRDFGYDLKASLALVNIGPKFLLNSSSNGRYYFLPFTYENEKMQITLCYNTYRTTLKEIEAESQNKGALCLDIRLVNNILESFHKIFEANLSVTFSRQKISKQRNDSCQSQSTHIFHAGSNFGDFTFGLDIPIATARHLINKAPGMDAQAIDESGINDFFAELVNQVGGEFIKLSSTLGYSFRRIFQGAFTTFTTMSYLNKTQGLTARYAFEVEGKELILVFGTNSVAIDQIFNVWNYYRRMSEFADTPESPALNPPAAAVSDSSSEEELSFEEIGVL
jgi:chemotaxis protein CheX